LDSSDTKNKYKINIRNKSLFCKKFQFLDKAKAKIEVIFLCKAKLKESQAKKLGINTTQVSNNFERQ
jgi:hypothetical protein